MNRARIQQLRFESLEQRRVLSVNPVILQGVPGFYSMDFPTSETSNSIWVYAQSFDDPADLGWMQILQGNSLVEPSTTSIDISGGQPFVSQGLLGSSVAEANVDLIFNGANFRPTGNGFNDNSQVSNWRFGVLDGLEPTVDNHQNAVATKTVDQPIESVDGSLGTTSHVSNSSTLEIPVGPTDVAVPPTTAIASLEVTSLINTNPDSRTMAFDFVDRGLETGNEGRRIQDALRHDLVMEADLAQDCRSTGCRPGLPSQLTQGPDLDNLGNQSTGLFDVAPIRPDLDTKALILGSDVDQFTIQVVGTTPELETPIGPTEEVQYQALSIAANHAGDSLEAQLTGFVAITETPADNAPSKIASPVEATIVHASEIDMARYHRLQLSAAGNLPAPIANDHQTAPGDTDFASQVLTADVVFASYVESPFDLALRNVNVNSTNQRDMRAKIADDRLETNHNELPAAKLSTPAAKPQARFEGERSIWQKAADTIIVSAGLGAMVLQQRLGRKTERRTNIFLR